jgi:predicted thioesterase
MNPGDTGRASLIVGPGDLATTVAMSPEDSFPEVFGTFRLVALMELAASRAMQGLLGPGQLSVGVRISITHTAATPLGARVTATATFVRQEGKFYVFKVEASDPAGPIGEGEHARAIVDTERLVKGAISRTGKP